MLFFLFLARSNILAKETPISKIAKLCLKIKMCWIPIINFTYNRICTFFFNLYFYHQAGGKYVSTSLALEFYHRDKGRFFACHFVYPFKRFMKEHPRNAPDADEYHLNLLAGNSLLRLTRDEVEAMKLAYKQLFGRDVASVFADHLVGFPARGSHRSRNRLTALMYGSFLKLRL